MTLDSNVIVVVQSNSFDFVILNCYLKDVIDLFYFQLFMETSYAMTHMRWEV